MAAVKQSTIDDISNLTPEQAKKLLLHMLNANDPPGFWRDVRRFTTGEFIEKLLSDSENPEHQLHIGFVRL